MKEEELMKNLSEMVATAELSVNDWNVLINVLNMPQQAQTLICAKLIEVLSSQIGPQVTKARETLESIKNVKEKN